MFLLFSPVRQELRHADSAILHNGVFEVRIHTVSVVVVPRRVCRCGDLELTLGRNADDPFKPLVT